MIEETARRLSFGEFTLDLEQRRLFTRDREIRLPPKGFDLLRLLIVNRPKALAKGELLARVWPDTFVTENNLAMVIADLRLTLGDDPHEPRFIRTAYAFGYAFSGEAAEQRSDPAAGESTSPWSLILQDREIVLQAGANILGRAGAGVVIVGSPSVSRHHARITIGSGRAVVEDLGSKNGTWLGQAPVLGPTAIRDGDELRLGSVVVTVRSRPSLLSTETVARPGITDPDLVTERDADDSSPSKGSTSGRIATSNISQSTGRK
jgi:DNA-binding winged helix-turn-helix (wHTH) protein